MESDCWHGCDTKLSLVVVVVRTLVQSKLWGKVGRKGCVCWILSEENCRRRDRSCSTRMNRKYTSDARTMFVLVSCLEVRGQNSDIDLRSLIVPKMSWPIRRICHLTLKIFSCVKT
jgi:hypothetical protein